jgi:hypothetical protein
MERSIESIWKEGFLESDALVAPKLNDLYNQKSKHIVDKLKRMFEINLYAIVIMAVVIWAGYALMGVPYAGFFIFLLLMGVFFLSRKQGKSLVNLNHGMSSYEYLTAFNNWMKAIISKNVTIMRFFYPLVFLASMAPIWYTFKSGDVTGKMLAEVATIFGIPVIGWIVVLLIMGLMVIFGGKIYRWDVNLVYGKTFRKLEELISDMDELRNQ